jgi:predicted NAD/FAD-binding protein
MNILQRLNADTIFCVTLNDSASVDPTQVLGRFTYAHPRFTLEGQAAQARHADVCGAPVTHGRTHFCGAYWRNGFHEDGVWSALRVARTLGCDEPAVPPTAPTALPAHDLLPDAGPGDMG